MQQVLVLIRPDLLTAAMSFSGHNSVDAPFGMPRITTERASDSNFSYHSSLPSQALIPHQTSLSQVKGRVSARKTGDTASNPCEKSRVPS